MGGSYRLEWKDGLKRISAMLNLFPEGNVVCTEDRKEILGGSAAAYYTVPLLTSTKEEEEKVFVLIRT